MTKHTTLNMFRRQHEAEERLARASMPRTSAACPETLPFMQDTSLLNSRRSARTLTVRPLTYKLAELLHPEPCDIPDQGDMADTDR